jgi:hypothetical protein
MNKDIKKLARKAGFVFWDDCEWKPDGAIIDWSSDYDKELERFAKLHKQYVIDQLIKEHEWTTSMTLRLSQRASASTPSAKTGKKKLYLSVQQGKTK